MVPGQKVVLLATQEGDLPALLRLWNDGEVMKWVGFPDGLGWDLAQLRDWLRVVQANPDRHHFTVYGGNGLYCGETYFALDPVTRRAKLDIKFMPEAQGDGRSRDALRALIDWIFGHVTEVDSVWVEPWGNNLAARTLYYSCGLRETERPADLPEGPSYWELARGTWEESDPEPTAPR
jgi:RimJ/RimL family protein N-acetyltransferase